MRQLKLAAGRPWLPWASKQGRRSSCLTPNTFRCVLATAVSVKQLNNGTGCKQDGNVVKRICLGQPPSIHLQSPPKPKHCTLFFQVSVCQCLGLPGLEPSAAGVCSPRRPTGCGAHGCVGGRHCCGCAVVQKQHGDRRLHGPAWGDGAVGG